MAKKTNSVLDSLVRGRNSKVLGPKKVRKILDKSDVESLHRILDESGDHASVWKSERLAEMSKRLEVGKIIRVKVEILNPPAHTANWKDPTGITGGEGKHWSGWVDVSADLFGMSPPRLIEYKRVQKEFWGKAGAGCLVLLPFPCIIPFPYAVGTTAIRALDQAAREAIAGVLEESTEDHRDTDPVGE
jgi:hypothetical protein